MITPGRVSVKEAGSETRLGFYCEMWHRVCVQVWEERVGETVESQEGDKHNEAQLQKAMKERRRRSNLEWQRRGSAREP